MEKLNKYFKRIENALKKLEKHKELAKEANENKEQIKILENEIVSLKKNSLSVEELVDQAIEEIKGLRKNALSEVKSDGWCWYLY